MAGRGERAAWVRWLQAARRWLPRRPAEERLKLALFCLVLSSSAWASWLWLWSLAARSEGWETRIWFNDWARRGFINEAWIEGVLFATAMVLNVVAAFRLAAVYRRQRNAERQRRSTVVEARVARDAPSREASRETASVG